MEYSDPTETALLTPRSFDLDLIDLEGVNLKELKEVKAFYDALNDVKVVIDKKISMIEEKFKLLNECREILRQEWERLNQEKNQMDALGAQQNSQVRLNVGGSLFDTSLDTLLKYKNSLLATMFSGKYALKKDANGAYFIDRDGTYFRYILNYLRDGEVILPEEKKIKLELLNEARFFQITGLVQQIERGEEREKNKIQIEFDGNDLQGITLSHENLTASSTNGNFKTVLTKQGFNSGKHYWEIQVNFGYNSIFCFMVGVASEQIDTSQALHSSPHAWCYRSDGTKSPPASGSKYGASFASNDLIGVMLDFENQTTLLKFFKNGIDQGVAFTTISATKLFPAISLNNLGDKCTIVKYVCYTPNNKERT
eukprot:TRINITY_DN8440_c0_g3_i2.p1 TRINITY_DN8440_c0_g3~~TRINITY_DN8440_c0_g3_i2.p1  ORF type:complete len:368 (+),score=72.13 TRINITY_DN8440_c0_g3_i2:407-1510(+)